MIFKVDEFQEYYFHGKGNELIDRDYIKTYYLFGIPIGKKKSVQSQSEDKGQKYNVGYK